MAKSYHELVGGGAWRHRRSPPLSVDSDIAEKEAGGEGGCGCHDGARNAALSRAGHFLLDAGGKTDHVEPRHCPPWRARTVRHAAHAHWKPGTYETLGGIHGVNVVDFGATFWEGSTQDSSVAFNEAIDFALSNGIGTVYIPRGTYRLNKPVVVQLVQQDMALSIVGDFAQLVAGHDGDMLTINSQNNPFLSMSGLYLRCENRARFGLVVNKLNHRFANIERIAVNCARRTGVLLQGCQAAVFRNLMSAHNGEFGIWVRGCTATVLDACSALQNASHGFTLESLGTDPITHQAGLNFTPGCTLQGVHSESNEGHGVLVRPGPEPGFATVGFFIRGGHFEANVLDGVSLQPGACGVVVSDCYFVPRTDGLNVDRHAIWVDQPQNVGKIRAFGNCISLSAGANYANLPQGVVPDHNIRINSNGTCGQ